MHPGLVATELTRELPGVAAWIRKLLTLTPAEGARTSILGDVTGARRGTGRYFDDGREKLASAEARDPVARARLWALTEELLQRPSREEQAPGRRAAS